MLLEGSETPTHDDARSAITQSSCGICSGWIWFPTGGDGDDGLVAAVGQE